MKKFLLFFTFAALALLPLKASVYLQFTFDGITTDDEVYIYPWITVDGQDIPFPDYAWPGRQMSLYNSYDEPGVVFSGESFYDFYDANQIHRSFTTVNFLIHRGIPDGQTEAIAKSQDFRGAIDGDHFVYSSDGSLVRNTMEVLRARNDVFKSENGLSNYSTTKNVAFFGMPNAWTQNNNGCAAWPYSAEQPTMAGTWPGDEMTWVASINGYSIYRWEQPDGEVGTPEKIIFNNNMAQGALQSPEYDFVNRGIYLGDYGLLTTVPEDVEINATNFPNDNFRTYVATFDLNSDNKLNTYERYRVVTIDIKKKNVGSVEGIEFFPELTTAALSDNSIHSVDFSGNPKLQRLTMQHNNTTTDLDLSTAPSLVYVNVSNNDMLATLNLTGLHKIKTLNCEYTLLTALDVTEMPLLEELNCSWCDIHTLDLSNCPELRNLNCYANSMTSLNLSGCDKLIHINCYAGNLTSLNVSHCTELQELYCYDNRITALDVSHCPQLRTLECSHNCLKTLDVSNCPQLTALECEGGEYTSDVLPNVLNTYFDFDVLDRLAPLFGEISGNELTTLDLSNNTMLNRLECGGNKLTSLNLSNNRCLNTLKANDNQLETITLSDSTAINTVNLGNNKLTTVEGLTRNTNISKLNLSNNPLADITALGTNQLANLSELNVAFIDLSSIGSLLDIAPATLRYLTAVDCNLTGIDLSVFPDLKEFDISNNAITTLDISTHSVLERFNASHCGLNSITLPTETSKLNVMCARHNNLTSLDLSAYTGLGGINVAHNALTQIIFPANLREEQCLVDCSFNQLETLDLSNVANLLALKANDNKISTFIPCSGPMIAPNLKNNKLSSINLSGKGIITVPALLSVYNATDEQLQSNSAVYAGWQFNDRNSSVEWMGNFLKSITRGEFRGNSLSQLFYVLYLMMPIQVGIDDLSVGVEGNCRDMQAASLFDRQEQKAVYYIKLADADTEPQAGKPRRVNLNSDDMFGAGFNPDAVDAASITGGQVVTRDDGTYLMLDPAGTSDGQAQGTVTYRYNTGAMSPATLIQNMNEGDMTPQQMAAAAEYLPDMSQVEFSFNWQAPVPQEVHTGITPNEKVAAQVVETRYINAQGVTAAAPFQGVNIVVKIYDDGHKTIEKVRF